ncbi:MAG: FAD-binding protein [Desulfobacterales bacterium]|nr:MAG: FAD-binding protein [Desulfobacterales bacterium]
MMTATIDTDVLVIGSGGAGCRAALEAVQTGCDVTLVTKGLFGKSGTTAFRVADTAGYNFADGIVDSEDNPDQHLADIRRAGKGMEYEELAGVLAADAVDTATFLEKLGVSFEKDAATRRYIEVTGCFASRPRMHIMRDHGEQIIRAMVPVIKGLPIRIVERTLIVDLIVNDGSCVGAVGIDAEGHPVVLRAKAVVLGCGGAGQLFKYTLTPKDITGDGYALGLRAGAELVNMEFMQVVLGTLKPTKNQFNTFLWCARPRLLNAFGEQFLDNYLPGQVTAEQCMDAKSRHFPFSTCDHSRYIEIAVQKETLKSDQDDHAGVFIDLTGITDDVVAGLPPTSPLPKVWPIVKAYMKKRGFSIDTEPVPVACFAHAINGGLKINTDGQTTLPGLYAAGEVAGGPHGADRLGGNMLVTCQVYGARAGRAAAKTASEKGYAAFEQLQDAPILDRIQFCKQQQGTLKVQQLTEHLQETMWRNALVVRNKVKLETALSELADLRCRMPQAKINSVNDLRSLIELGNLLDVGEAIITAALHRTESRGSHYREDYPAQDPRWDKRILIGYRKGEIVKREERS